MGQNSKKKEAEICFLFLTVYEPASVVLRDPAAGRQNFVALAFHLLDQGPGLSGNGFYQYRYILSAGGALHFHGYRGALVDTGQGFFHAGFAGFIDLIQEVFLVGFNGFVYADHTAVVGADAFIFLDGI